MSSYDRCTITFPGGTSYSLSKEMGYDESFQPFWVFDGAGNAAALSGYVPGLADKQNSEQVFIGTGGKVRRFTITGAVNAKGMDDWGDADADADILTKVQYLGNDLATTRVDSTRTATLEVGEYSEPGEFDPVDVVYGEIDLPAQFGEGESPSTTIITLNLLASVDASGVIHQANPR